MNPNPVKQAGLLMNSITDLMLWKNLSKLPQFFKTQD